MLLRTSRDRTTAGRGLRAGDRDVLLEHEPALVPGLLREDRGPSSIPASPSAERPEQTGLRGVHCSERVAVA